MSELGRRCARHRDPSEELGLYLPNTFLVELGESMPFVTAKGEGESVLSSDARFTPIFFHEYWHYLHNVTTVEGFMKFSLMQQLLYRFNETLLPHGTGLSSGSADGSLAGWLEAERLRDGEFDPTTSGDRFQEVSVRDVLERTELVTLNGNETEIPRVDLELDLHLSDGSTRLVPMPFGACAIEESVAYLVETAVSGIPGAEAMEAPPLIPYRILERLIVHLSRSSPKPITSAAIGTLALLTGSAGQAAVDLARDLGAALANGHTEDQWRSAVVSNFKPAIERGINTILSKDLPSILEAHQGRGLVEGAVQYFAETIRTGLERRLVDPIFDLRCVLPEPSTHEIAALQADFPPCDVLQRRPGTPDTINRDLLGVLHTSSEDARGFTPSDYLRSLQAQQHYLMAHLNDRRRGFDPSNRARDECPYFTTCDLPPRVDEPRTCSREPWKLADRAQKGCWYSTAVKATLGIVQVSRPESDDGPEA